MRLYAQEALEEERGLREQFLYFRTRELGDGETKSSTLTIASQLRFTSGLFKGTKARGNSETRLSIEISHPVTLVLGESILFLI